MHASGSRLVHQPSNDTLPEQEEGEGDKEAAGSGGGSAKEVDAGQANPKSRHASELDASHEEDAAPPMPQQQQQATAVHASQSSHHTLPAQREGGGDREAAGSSGGSADDGGADDSKAGEAAAREGEATNETAAAASSDEHEVNVTEAPGAVRRCLQQQQPYLTLYSCNCAAPKAALSWSWDELCHWGSSADDNFDSLIAQAGDDFAVTPLELYLRAGDASAILEELGQDIVVLSALWEACVQCESPSMPPNCISACTHKPNEHMDRVTHRRHPCDRRVQVVSPRGNDTAR